LCVSKLSPALTSQQIKRAVAKQTVKDLPFFEGMTWKILTLAVLKKFEMFHP
jgi:hypothetical protein